MKSLIASAAWAIPAAAMLFLGSLAAWAQEPPKAARAAVEDVYLARDDGGGRAGDVVSEFGTADIPIHCVVVLDASAKVTVKMNFVAVNVPGVKADSKVVSATYTTTETQNRVNFTGRPDGKWVPGRYRVDIFLDGKQEKQLEFNIRGAAVTLPAASKFIQPGRPKPKPKN